MDPIEPWVDRDELRRLADALLAHPPSASPPSHDAAYGDDFVGYAGGATDPPVSSQPPAPLPPQAQAPAPPERTGQELNARRALANARKIAQRGGLLGNHASPPENPPDDPITFLGWFPGEKSLASGVPVMDMERMQLSHFGSARIELHAPL